MRIIRPSQLTSYNNCARSVAAKLWSEDVALAGFSIPRLPAAAGAAVGKTAHAIIADMLIKKRDEGRTPEVSEYKESIEQKFVEEIDREGIEWDATTRDEFTAVKQITSQVAIYRAYVMPAKNPVLVEEKLTAELSPGLNVEGTLDHYDADGYIDDQKFGARFKHHGIQLATYGLLLEAHGKPVKGIREYWIPRVGPKTAAKEPRVTEYPYEANKKEAVRTIKRAAADIARFTASGDPSEFVANPNAQTCTPKYCPAWGTNFCSQWQGKPVKEE